MVVVRHPAPEDLLLELLLVHVPHDSVGPEGCLPLHVVDLLLDLGQLLILFPRLSNHRLVVKDPLDLCRYKGRGRPDLVGTTDLLLLDPSASLLLIEEPRFPHPDE